MTIFTLKIVACISMFLDHIRYVNPIFNNFVSSNLGRIAFPLFAFFITEGYVHTKDLKKYYKRLLLFALISQIPFMLFRTLVGEWKMLNVIFTLILGLICITVYDKFEKKYLSIPICLIIICLGEIINVDYGWFGVALTFAIYLGRKNKIILSLLYTAILYTYFTYNKVSILNNFIYFIFHLIPLLFISLYNGEKGKDCKYFYYFFYPIHMMIFYLITLI